MKPTGQLQLCGRDKIKQGHFTPLKRKGVKPWLKDQQEGQDVQVNQLVHESAYYQVHGQKGKQGQKRSTLEEKASSRGMSPMSTALYDPIKAMRNVTDETIAISTIGVKRDKKAKKLWEDGMAECLRRLKPTAVLVYGGLIDFDFKGIKVIEIKNSVTERWRGQDD
ncbi:MAG: DUF4417 domain-containing protein [Prevotellaceae bacterium]|nr:DUF4417 domain-containing protein [Prevotellaceae bacterium]